MSHLRRMLTLPQPARWIGLLAAVTASGLLAACSSTGSSATSATSPVPARTSGSGGLTAADVKVALGYTGGTAGRANTRLSPITIGFVNQQGGIPSSPEGTAAARAAVAFINDRLGGIHGHPLKLAACFIASAEEQGQICAQQMVNNKSVVMIDEGTTVVGASSFHQTLAGRLPVFAYVPVAPADPVAKNTFMVNAGNNGIVPGMETYLLKYLHAKSVAVLGPNHDAAAVAGNAKLVADLRKAGVTVKQSSFPSTQSNLVAPLVAAGAQSASAIAFIANNPSLVIAADKALAQLNIKAPVLSVGLALVPAIKASLGDYPKWTYIFLSENAALPDRSGEVATFVAAMNTYGGKSPVLTSTAPDAFGTLMMDARILNASYPHITPAAIAAKMKAFTGPGYMFPPTYHFGSDAAQPALGTLQTRFYTYEGNGLWADATKGRWITP